LERSHSTGGQKKEAVLFGEIGGGPDFLKSRRRRLWLFGANGMKFRPVDAKIRRRPRFAEEKEREGLGYLELMR
jgi:hypothetical protein